MQVIHALVDVIEPADGLPGQVRGGRAQILEFRVKSDIKRQSHHIGGRQLVLVKTVNLGAIEI
jgi:hypothetical protein